MEIARISKGDFGKRHCNTEMSTVIPINLKSAVTWKWQNLLTSEIGVGGVGINNEDVQLERKLDHLLNKLI